MYKRKKAAEVTKKDQTTEAITSEAFQDYNPIEEVMMSPKANH